VPAAEREDLLERWYAERLAPGPGIAELTRAAYRLVGGQIDAADQARLERLHRHVHDARVLCVTRGRPTGTLAVNAWLHRRHGGGRPAFIAGEPVMMLCNDYDRS